MDGRGSWRASPPNGRRRPNPATPPHPAHLCENGRVAPTPSSSRGPFTHVTSDEVSLPEVHGTVAVPTGAGFWRKMFAFAGPGYLVAVGYMDPGNWATDIAGGARYGYTLLTVVFASNLIAILLQSLAARLGIASGRDLAQACRDRYSYRATIVLWILAEIAIAATDLAEVIGSAIALNLLFGLPMTIGVCLTSADVLIVLYLQHHKFRYVEALVVLLIAGIAAAFAVELFYSRPDLAAVAHGFLPSTALFHDREMLYLAVGILGATVMPHNLYLHSSIVQTRKYGDSNESRGEAVSFAVIDSTVALTSALFINGAILVVAAATFHGTGYDSVADISDAYKLLAPLLGTTLASTMFALALLFAGQNATLTGTLAGQIVMEGFLNLRMRPWLRRLMTRAVAIVPALITVILYGERGSGSLLIFSQVILSLQLPFAVIPLILFTSDKRRMGGLAIGTVMKLVAWPCAALITVLNVWLLWTTIVDWF
jgi:manganese transport protein